MLASHRRNAHRRTTAFFDSVDAHASHGQRDSSPPRFPEQRLLEPLRKRREQCRCESDVAVSEPALVILMRGSESPPTEQFGCQFRRGRCHHVVRDGPNVVPTSVAHPPLIFTSCSQDASPREPEK